MSAKGPEPRIIGIDRGATEDKVGLELRVRP